jgi:hypothetical protein
MEKKEKEKLTDWGPVHRDVAGNPDISYGARALYALLCTYRNIHTSACFPGTNLLTEKMGTDRFQINKWFLELESQGVVERITRNTDKGKRLRTIVIKDEIYYHNL